MLNCRRALIRIGLVIGLVALTMPHVSAQSSSVNYEINEYQFGTGGELDASSPNFQARSSSGALGVGEASSSNFDVIGGSITPDAPFIELAVTEATLDLNTLSDTATSSGTAQGGDCSCSFYVRSYLSSQYVVATVSSPPVNESGTALAAKSILGAPSSDQNVEEFGINLVDNSSPDIGTDPFNDPDNTFADGAAATGYGTPNQFKYVIGDIIARSPATAGRQAVGKTNYTISYIAKRKPLTEAGLYTMRHDLVAVGTF